MDFILVVAYSVIDLMPVEKRDVPIPSTTSLSVRYWPITLDLIFEGRNKYDPIRTAFHVTIGYLHKHFLIRRNTAHQLPVPRWQRSTPGVYRSCRQYISQMCTVYVGKQKLRRANWRRGLGCMLRPTFTATKIKLCDSSPVMLSHHHCSCVAGTVLCNHLAALLFQTAHYSSLKLPVVPPVHSCTESEQQWHKPRTMDPHWWSWRRSHSGAVASVLPFSSHRITNDFFQLFKNKLL